MADAENHLYNLLHKVSLKHGFNNPEIVIEQVYSGGANYTSKLYTVVVKEDNKNDLHLFAKVSVMGEKMREEVPWDIFEREVLAYTELFKLYQQIEEQNAVPKQHRLVFTKMYDYDLTTYNETMVLENLVAQGFGDFDRFHSMDWPYASSAITELAKLHALSFALKEYYPEEFQKFLVKFKSDWNEVKHDTMTENSMVHAMNTVNPKYRDSLEKYLQKYMKDIFVTFTAPVSHTVIIHGDYRGNNLLHRLDKDGTVDIKIVDLQTLQGGCPVTDLLYFIFTGSDEQFRAQYYDKLVEDYYTHLAAAVTRLRLDPEKTYSRAEFEKELKEKLYLGLGMAVFTLPVMTIESENAPKVDEHLQLTNFAVAKTNDLYEERLNGVVNDFVKWGVLKTILDDSSNERQYLIPQWF